MGFDNFTKEECVSFLSERYGMRGYKGSGLTKTVENRTIENLRKECEIQNLISD